MRGLAGKGAVALLVAAAIATPAAASPRRAAISALRHADAEILRPSQPLTLDSFPTPSPTGGFAATVLAPRIGAGLASEGTLVSVQLPRTLRSPLVIGAGDPDALTLRALGVARRSTAARVVHGATAVYALTASGVDTALRPLTNGVAVIEDLRERRAARSFTFAVDPDPAAQSLPGARAVQLGTRAVAVVRSGATPGAPTSDGVSGLPRPLLGVSAAAAEFTSSQLLGARAQRLTHAASLLTVAIAGARDARGRIVRASLRVRDGRIVLKVRTRRMATYPVAVELTATRTSPTCAPDDTWTDVFAPFAFPFKPADGLHLPGCRLFSSGVTDHRGDGALSAYVAGSAVQRSHMSPIVDSYGSTLARYSWDPASGVWDIYDREATAVIDHASAIELQGHGCMAAAHARSADWVLAGFKGSAASLRAFIPLADVEPRAVRDHLDGFSTGCGENVPPPPEPSVRSLLELLTPRLDPVRYLSSRGAGGPLESGSYHSYSIHTLAPGTSSQVSYVPIAAATTAVRGGGVIRAIVPVSDTFQTLAVTGYPDPNVPCGGPQQQAAWRYGRIGHGGSELDLWGYVPVRFARAPRPC